MDAVYVIRDCGGHEVERIQITLPAGCIDPLHPDAEAEALSITGYDGHGRCDYCGNPSYVAHYVRRPIPPIDCDA